MNEFSTNELFKNNTPSFEAPIVTPIVSKILFTAKHTVSVQRFDDLDSFRQDIEHSKAGLHHQPYTNNKKSFFLYKLIFLGFFLVIFCTRNLCFITALNNQLWTFVQFMHISEKRSDFYLCHSLFNIVYLCLNDTSGKRSRFKMCQQSKNSPQSNIHEKTGPTWTQTLYSIVRSTTTTSDSSQAYVS